MFTQLPYKSVKLWETQTIFHASTASQILHDIVTACVCWRWRELDLSRVLMRRKILMLLYTFVVEMVSDFHVAKF